MPFDDLFKKYEHGRCAGGGPDLFIAPNDSLGSRRPARASSPTSTPRSPASSRAQTEIAVDGSKVDGKLYMVPESLKAVAL